MYSIGFAITVLAMVATMGFTKAQDPIITANRTVVEKFGSTSVLQCEVDNLGSYLPMEWHFGEPPELIVADPEKYIISNENGTLAIKKTMPEDIGEYTCSIKLNNGKSFNQTVSLESKPWVAHFEKSKNLVEDDPLVLECEAVGSPTPEITWLKDGINFTEASNPRVSFKANKEGIMNGSMRIDNLNFDDRGEYTCVATNEYGVGNSTILVRVKDKLAALWPFLGICAEVAILVIIIFVYEHRRSKKLDEMDAREEAEHMTNSHAHKGGADEVRQRK